MSPVTVEKWEQKGNQEIRPKYLPKLASLGGIGAAGIGAGLIAAPAVLPIAAAASIGALLGSLISDGEVKRAGDAIEKLKKLTVTERKTLIALLKKIES